MKVKETILLLSAIASIVACACGIILGLPPALVAIRDLLPTSKPTSVMDVGVVSPTVLVLPKPPSIPAHVISTPQGTSGLGGPAIGSTPTLLNVGQIWTKDGVVLALQPPDIQVDKIVTRFILKNNTNTQIMFTFGLEAFSGQDNLGTSAKVVVPNRCICSTGTCYTIPQEPTITPHPCYPSDNAGYTTRPWWCGNTTATPTSSPSCIGGTGNTIVKPGESLGINTEFSNMNLINTQVTEVVIRVNELSRIKNVGWRIVIPH